MKVVLYLFVLLISFTSFCQDLKDANVLYVIDSIPIYNDPPPELSTLSPDDIARIDVIKDKELIQKKYNGGFDGIIIITTKAFELRSDSVKSIPSTLRMNKVNGTWFYRNQDEPYSGYFIDYFPNGKKEGQGYLNNGRLEGERSTWYPNGNLKFERTYKDGLENGTSREYHSNGLLRQTGNILNGKEEGLWMNYHQNGELSFEAHFEQEKIVGEVQMFYSSGKLKGVYFYENGILKYTKEQLKFNKLYNDGVNLNKSGLFEDANSKFTKALLIDSNSVDCYFARGTAFLNLMRFDEAIEDFSKAIEIENFHMESYANRGSAIIHKAKFGKSRTLSKNQYVTVLSGKDGKLSEDERIAACNDLNKAIELGDKNEFVLKLYEENCQN